MDVVVKNVDVLTEIVADRKEVANKDYCENHRYGISIWNTAARVGIHEVCVVEQAFNYLLVKVTDTITADQSS